MSSSLTSRIEQTVAKLAADPASGRSVSTVTAATVNGRGRLSSGPFNWDTDLGPAIGGENLAPSPTAYLLGALAGCAVVFLRDTLAPQFEVSLDEVTATARCTSETAGLLGIEGTDPGLQGIELEIDVRSASSADRVETVLAAWRERCPIYLGLIQSNDVRLAISLNGETAAT